MKYHIDLDCLKKGGTKASKLSPVPLTRKIKSCFSSYPTDSQGMH